MKQTDDAKKGEVAFRKKLYEQQVLQQSVHFRDELSGEEIESIIRKRMDDTAAHMEGLRAKDILLSPYVEIGAERGQRSLVMENELACEGAATDISFYSLKSCDYYKEQFDQKKVPLRICCDVNTLPFMSNSLPFVFCYETLHHFPNLVHVFDEIYRVLAPGGCLFFAEEPFEQKLHVPLYDQDKLYSEKMKKRSTVMQIIDKFFGERSYNETEYGIVENFHIPLEEWEQCLAPFENHAVRLTSVNTLTTSLSGNRAVRFLMSLLGGEICGTCFKPLGSATPIARTTDVKEALMCPACRTDTSAEVKLEWHSDKPRCPRCSTIYHTRDDVLLLLAPDLEAELYPEFAADDAVKRDSIP